MAIDPWIYASGAPPAAGSPPYRSTRNAQSGQGFATFLRNSLDQAMTTRSTPRSSVNSQTSSAPLVVRGKVDLGARPDFTPAPESGKSEAENMTAAKPETAQANAEKSETAHVSATKSETARSGVAKPENGPQTAGKPDAEPSHAGDSDVGKAPVPEKAVSTGAQRPAREATSPFSADEESVLRAVAALQARSVKPSSASARSGHAAKAEVEVPVAVSQDSLDVDAAVADLDKLAKTAKSQMGKRYVLGGDNPKSGFDCSGFTNWVYGEAGVDIARNSRAQFHEGTPVSRDNLQKGDLVFFGSKKRVHHVGMYLGDGQFIHSASTGRAVRISSLDNPFWSRTYAGARRVVVQSAAKDGHKHG